MENGSKIKVKDMNSYETVLKKIKEAFPEAIISLIDYRLSREEQWTRYDIRIQSRDFRLKWSLFNNKDVDVSKRSFDEFIKVCKDLYSKIEYIQKVVKQRFTFKEFEFDHFSDIDDDPYVLFRLVHIDTEEEEIYHIKTNPDTFIDTLQKYFVTELQGLVKVIREDGYFVDYEIDGIPLRQLLLNGNQVRIKRI